MGLTVLALTPEPGVTGDVNRKYTFDMTMVTGNWKVSERVIRLLVELVTQTEYSPEMGSIFMHIKKQCCGSGSVS